MVALILCPMQSYAERALNYGDINDEDGRYVSWNTSASNVKKISYESKSKQNKKLNAKTKKVSAEDLSSNNSAGYGDLDQDED